MNNVRDGYLIYLIDIAYRYPNEPEVFDDFVEIVKELVLKR